MLQMWIIWLIIMGVLLTIEVMTQMMWTLCLAIGCLGALIAEFCGLGLVGQVIIMAVVAFMAYIILVPLFQKYHALKVDAGGTKARTGMDALLGRRAFLSEEIRPDKPGRARIDGDHWQVRAADSLGIIPAGTEVVVTGFDSIILTVEPINKSD